MNPQRADILVAYRSGDRLRAALHGSTANLGLGGVTTVLGISDVGLIRCSPIAAGSAA